MTVYKHSIEFLSDKREIGEAATKEFQDTFSNSRIFNIEGYTEEVEVT